MTRHQKLHFLRERIYFTLLPSASLEALSDEDLDHLTAIMRTLENGDHRTAHDIAPLVEAYLRHREFLGYWDADMSHWAVVSGDVRGVGDTPGEAMTDFPEEVNVWVRANLDDIGQQQHPFTSHCAPATVAYALMETVISLRSDLRK